MHKSITFDRIEAIMQESMYGLMDQGICLDCGAEAYGVEPDAFEYECESCGEYKVCGAEGLLLSL